MTFELQGHRGCRGLKPENTLLGFETAIDLGVGSIETDVQRTRDGGLVLFHDFVISDKLCRRLDESAPDPASHPALRDLTLAQVRRYAADRNPDPKRFPTQQTAGASLPCPIPTLAEFFQLAKDYAQSPVKTPEQQARARRLIFDVEIKARPFRGPDHGIEDDVAAALRLAKVVGRSRVRSFDHRIVRRLLDLLPGLEGAVLITGTAPIDPVELTRRAGAQVYAPDFEFLDQAQVRQCHAAGIRVLPWTVNELPDLEKLLDWGVDGITTDYPDRLAALLQRRGIAF